MPGARRAYRLASGSQTIVPSSGATNRVWAALRSFRKADKLSAVRTTGGLSARRYSLRSEGVDAALWGGCRSLGVACLAGRYACR